MNDLDQYYTLSSAYADFGMISSMMGKQKINILRFNITCSSYMIAHINGGCPTCVKAASLSLTRQEATQVLEMLNNPAGGSFVSANVRGYFNLQKLALYEEIHETLTEVIIDNNSDIEVIKDFLTQQIAAYNKRFGELK